MYNILRYIPLKGAQQIATADEIVCNHGALAIRNMRNGGSSSRNLFGQMLEASDGEEIALTDEDVRDEAGNLIVAGSDTTASPSEQLCCS